MAARLGPICHVCLNYTSVYPRRPGGGPAPRRPAGPDSSTHTHTDAPTHARGRTTDPPEHIPLASIFPNRQGPPLQIIEKVFRSKRGGPGEGAEGACVRERKGGGDGADALRRAGRKNSSSLHECKEGERKKKSAAVVGAVTYGPGALFSAGAWPAMALEIRTAATHIICQVDRAVDFFSLLLPPALLVQHSLTRVTFPAGSRVAWGGHTLVTIPDVRSNCIYRFMSN